MAHRSPSFRLRRRGATTVELAVVLPVFFLFVFSLIEYGRLQLVSNLLNSACRSGARYGATEGITSASAQGKVQQILGAAVDINHLTVAVKDASVFDDDIGSLPGTAEDYEAMPNMTLETSDPRQLFLIRASIDYNDIAFVPFSILDGVTLYGQAFMRHE
jgi:Flp pilus assembly protein TadG